MVKRMRGEEGGGVEGKRKRCKQGEQRERRGKLWVEEERSETRRKERRVERREDIWEGRREDEQ